MAPDPDDVTDEEEKLLVMYIAKYNREHDGRDSTRLYKILVNSDGARSWSRKHDWRIWHAYYIDNRERMDALIAVRLKESTNTRIPPRSKASARKPTKKAAGTNRRVRVDFTDADDDHLVAYLAVENPLPKDRQGMLLYERLVADSKGLWPWSTRHTAQSWRERYRKHDDSFDRDIKRFMKKRGFKPSDVSNEKQRRKMWEKLDGNGDEQPSPEQPKVEMAKKKASRPASNVRKGREEDAVQQDVEPPASEKAKGKRRAADDNDEERVRKKTRVVKAVEHAPETEERAVSSGDNLVPRALSIPPIAAVEASDTEPSSTEDQLLSFETDGGKQVAERPVNLAPGDNVQASTHDAATSPGELGAQSAQHAPASPATLGDGHLDETNFAPSNDMRMGSQEVYPATSTPRHEAFLPASQAIPTPRTLAALAAKDSEIASPNILPIQEPTPPTSDAPFSPDLRHADEVNSPPAHASNQVDELRSQPRSPTPRHPSSSPVSTPSPPQRHISKQKSLKKHKEDTEFFGTPPNASPPGSSSTPERRRARQLPIRAEGALNSALTDAEGLSTAIRKGARRKSDIVQDAVVDEELPEWPPKRRKAAPIVGQKAPLSRKEGLPPAPLPQVKTKASDDVLPSSSAAPKKDHHPFSQPSPEVPSRIHHPFSQPTQLPYESAALAGPSIAERETSMYHPFSDESRDPSPVPEHASKARASYPNGRPGELVRQPVHLGLGLGLGPSDFVTAPTLPAGPSTSTPWGSHVDKGKQRAVADYDPDLLANRRHTFGGLFPLADGGAQVRRPRLSLSSPSPTSSSSSGPVRLTPGDVVLDPQDHEEVYKVMLKRAVRKTGFSKDVVRQVWHATGSWTAACEILNGERVQERAGHAIVEGIEEHSRVEASRSSGDLGFGSLVLLRDGRAQTPPARAAPAAPPESPAYVPPDNSRAAIYLKTHGLFGTARKERLSEEPRAEDDADAEEDDPAIPILPQGENLETRDGSRPGQGAPNATKLRIDIVERILATDLRW